MNWEAIGAIGEAVGAVAVVLTLGYLAVQLRQNTRQLKDHSSSVFLSSFTAIEESFSRFRMAIGSDAALASLWLRATTDFNSLDGHEKEQAYKLIHEFFVMHQNMHSRLSMLQGEEPATDIIEEWLLREFSNPGLMQWWQRYHEKHFIPGFRELANRVANRIAGQ